MLRNDPLRNPEALIERVYSYVAYRIGGGADAEDVTSETFERAVRYRHSYDPAHGTPLAWVLGIARRCTNDALAARRHGDVALNEAQAPGDLEAEAADRLELESALAQLPPADAELLSLRYGADLSAKQIAEAMNSTPGAVRVGLHRAHARLRAIVEDGRQEPVPQARIQIQPAP
ncbi:MAG TPA: sigma-70 family RNA polymerase sigma factor [Gaiellaceae bacterium]|nr:sigma-70 family RNA polymerase sigma factor [Gaiellaceae bacterium]